MQHTEEVESPSLRGRFIVASPALVDPNFRKTVVLIAEHTADGAMGLVLNRQTPASVADAVPHLTAITGESALVFVGGPVERTSVFVLADFADPAQAGSLVLWDIGLFPPDTEPAEAVRIARQARVYAGYAGWGPGQLEDELEEEAWIVADPAEEDIFTAEPEKLWSRVLRRKGGHYGVLALMPDDPRLN